MKTITTLLVTITAASLVAQDGPSTEARRARVKAVEAEIKASEDIVHSLKPSATHSYAQGAVGFLMAKGDSSIPPLVIKFREATPEKTLQLEEDLTVMSHLLEKSITRLQTAEHPSVKMGIPMLLSNSKSVRSAYIEDFGVLFMIKLNFPLVGEAEKKDEKTDKERASSDWEKARREVLGIREPKSSERVAYDADQVNALKKELIGTFKEAAHIRNIGGDEYVAITLFGQPSRVRVSKTSTSSTANRFVVEESSSNGSVMTLRVRKSDVDAVANGKMNLEEFTEKVSTQAYAASGYDVTSLNSWVGTSSSRRF